MSFGDKRVIQDLSFEVETGETFGFLGSNGSGKTTTLRALLGMIVPTSGTLHIGGTPYQPGGNTRVGYLPEERGLYRKESTLEVMTYFAELKGYAKPAAVKWATDYLERVGLADKAKTKLGSLSGGQQQKIQLGTALMGEPELLVLDEPTKGLDPVNRQLLMELINEQQQHGATVILVTHQMDEVERLCDRILLLRDGRAEAYGPLAAVQEQYGGRRIRVRAARGIPPSSLYQVTKQDGDRYDLQPAVDTDDATLLAELVRADVGVSAFESRATSMDEIFVHVYGRAAHEDAA
ncbi:MAG: ABC transporter ATP-binding protein [Candidatus Lumbricidophila eiseniae]|uniref:ABC transporter ATP-binding protein n=1 Tax=Candidatus Lumbricidiphila eiseniae TaxID=1969409 RepID=A0A2A6FT95_9MICO|nr:MAG: ABC transporter ATP-binding protein [Candidatus Lumbricidophila eiseniae]